MSIDRRRALQLGAMALLPSLGLPPATAAEPVVLSDVKFTPTIALQGRELLLNGAGLRYKAIFKVYAAGLYLEKKANTPADVYAMGGPKRLSVTMLRDIDATELGKLFSRGIEDNMDKHSFSKLIPGVMRMSQIFSDNKKLLEGDNFTVDWLPGTGTAVSVKGKQQGGPFKEPEFFNALLSIWLGNQPADWRLKDALLGRTSS